jgi:enoyl-CoA hydratase/carnithine racemase
MILTEDQGRVRVLTLNRPEALNAFNSELFEALANALIAADADENVAVVVLTGAGRAFSAGADLAQAPQSSGNRIGVPEMLEALLVFSKPLLLAINGLAVGIGATMCGLADLVFIASTARLRCPFVRLGLVPEAASTLTFPALMGRQQANWMLMSSEWMDAQSSKDAGLAFAVCEPGSLMQTTLDHARKLAVLPITSLRETKRLIVEPQRDAMRQAIQAEIRMIATLRGGPANQEAVNAFREKREPDFSRLK